MPLQESLSNQKFYKTARCLVSLILRIVLSSLRERRTKGRKNQFTRTSTPYILNRLTYDALSWIFRFINHPLSQISLFIITNHPPKKFNWLRKQTIIRPVLLYCTLYSFFPSLRWIKKNEERSRLHCCCVHVQWHCVARRYTVIFHKSQKKTAITSRFH
jgi:hypothetical protein